MDVSWTLQTKQAKERKEIFLGFSKVKWEQKKREIFLLFLQNKKEQRRTGKNSEKIKKWNHGWYNERGEVYVLPQV